MPEIGRPGQQVSILRGDDIDPATGRLLSVAELQDALAAAVRVRAARLAARSTPRATLPAEPTVDSSRPGVGTGTDDAADSGTSPPDAIPIDTGRTDGGACPDREHPTVPDPEADRPDPTAPAAAAAAAVEAAGDDDAPGPPGERVREWGANPVPVSAGPGERPVMVQLPVQPSPSPGPGRYRFPVSDLLRCRPRDRDRRAARVLAGGWPGPRRVVVGSLTGGAGRSTTAAVMCAAAVDAGVPVLALDATGGDDDELAARIGSGAAAGRDWTRLTGRDTEVDFAALRRRAGADGNPVAVVAVGGDAGAPPPADAVAAGAAAAATAWPLVVVDIGHGQAATGAAVRAGGIDLLVLVCRADPAEIADSCEFLTALAAAGEMDCAQRAVVAVRADRRGVPGAARRTLAAVAAASAGPVPVPYVARLAGRRAAAQGPDAVAAGRLLLAVAALTPTGHRPGALPPASSPRSSE